MILAMMFIFTACSVDDKIKQSATNAQLNANSAIQLAQKIDKESKASSSFNTYLSYQQKETASTDIKSIATMQTELKDLLLADSSSDEKRIQQLTQIINKKLKSPSTTQYLGSLNSFAKMKKDAPLYLHEIDSKISKVKSDIDNPSSQRNLALAKLDTLSTTYANKSGYFANKKEDIEVTLKELEAYKLIAQDADANKDDDIEALISLKNIKENADLVYNDYATDINKIDDVESELKETYEKVITGKSIKQDHYVYYIPTYKLDNMYNPQPSSRQVNNSDYNRYKMMFTVGNDIQYIGGTESLIVGFDDVDQYYLNFQTYKNGKVTKEESLNVDRELYQEMDAHMKRFDTDKLVVENKVQGQFYDEMSTIPYPQEYGSAYTMVGNPAYGSWSGTGDNATWSFSDIVMAGFVGNMLGNSYGRSSYNSRGYYSRSSYNRSSSYYRSNGYGGHYDRYSDYNYNRTYGNYTRKSKTYTKTKKANSDSRLYTKAEKVAKPSTTKATKMATPKTPSGFNMPNKRVASAAKPGGVSYKSYAKAKRPMPGKTTTPIASSSKGKSGFQIPTSRVKSTQATRPGNQYKSKARPIKPASSTAKKYDMTKRLSSNKALQSRISAQSKKRIEKTKKSPKYVAAKKKRVAETKRKAEVKRKAEAKKKAEAKRKKDAAKAAETKRKKAAAARKKAAAKKRARARKTSSRSSSSRKR